MAKKKETPQGTVEVTALNSFSAMVNGQIVTIVKGQRFLMPLEHDWIESGLVQVVSKKIETSDPNAKIETPENGTVPPAIDQAAPPTRG